MAVLKMASACKSSKLDQWTNFKIKTTTAMMRLKAVDTALLETTKLSLQLSHNLSAIFSAGIDLKI
jgi:hypothetical protein